MIAKLPTPYGSIARKLCCKKLFDPKIRRSNHAAAAANIA